MKNTIILAVLSSLIAVAAITLSYRSPVGVESLIGYATVLGLVGLASLDYRGRRKRLFGRN